MPNAPAALRDLVQQKRAGQTVGAALDAELGKLYALCVELDAPIMAHCASSELAAPDDDCLPGPKYWRQALTAFPQLRANLGHFGGIWAFAPSDASEAQAKSTALARQWATDIATLMHDFANVYADAAYFDLALVDTIVPGSPTAQALEFIANLAQEYSLVPRRLMYASDWIMVAQLTAGNDYARRLAQSMSQIFRDAAAQEDFRWRNAARFLGLGAGDRTRARLATFLGADSALLSRFDPAQ
jgi:predicted TIM-barrel fold metal-dependent hydrolase